MNILAQKNGERRTFTTIQWSLLGVKKEGWQQVGTGETVNENPADKFIPEELLSFKRSDQPTGNVANVVPNSNEPKTAPIARSIPATAPQIDAQPSTNAFLPDFSAAVNSPADSISGNKTVNVNEEDDEYLSLDNKPKSNPNGKNK